VSSNNLANVDRQGDPAAAPAADAAPVQSDEVTHLRAILAERTAQLTAVSEELERANRARTDFLANVSHELRTPLTAILGFTELLARGVDGPLNPRQHEDAATILASSQRLLELVDDLIDLSRVEADRVELQTRPIDLGPLLADAIEGIRPRAGEKGILLALDPIPGPLVVEADPARVKTILFHLLGNAIKFTPARGSVRASGSLEASTDGQQAMARIDIVDSGVGIAPDDQERIFEKFQRLGGPEQTGTGLGLTIARELARLHGGTLTLDSTLGLGSRFSLRLPVAPRRGE
jgi:two-component system, sensor histidine kinase and response regulator